MDEHEIIMVNEMWIYSDDLDFFAATGQKDIICIFIKICITYFNTLLLYRYELMIIINSLIRALNLPMKL